MAASVLWHFGFSPEAMFAQAVKIKADLATSGGKTAEEAAKIGQSIMGPGNFVKDPISAISFSWLCVRACRDGDRRRFRCFIGTILI